MKKIIFCFLFLWLTACDFAGASKHFTYHGRTIRENDAAISVVRQFLAWYRQHYNELKAIRFIPQDNGKEQYRIDYKAVDTYIQSLKYSSLLSDSYLNDLRNNFTAIDKKMLSGKQTEGAPVGLEADIVLRTHEIKETLLKIEKSEMRFHPAIQKDGIINVCVDILYTLKFSLVKEGDTWKINQIIPAENNCR